MAAFAGNHVLKEADIRVLASNFKRLPIAVIQLCGNKRFLWCDNCFTKTTLLPHGVSAALIHASSFTLTD